MSYLEENIADLKTLEITVDKGQSAMRIDKFLIGKTENVARNKIKNAAELGCILVNGEPVKQNYKVRPLDKIILYYPKSRHVADLTPQDIKQLLDNTAIQDLNALTGLKKIKNLDISHTGITTLKGIENFGKLEVLNVEFTSIKSLEPLVNLSSLKENYGNNSPISSLKGIEKSDKLEILYCNETKISSLKEIENCSNLKELNISDTKVSSSTVLEKLTSLEKIYVKNTLLSKQLEEENKETDIENN